MAGADAETAPAKVNLALHVTGRRSDGYHLLDSLVAFADVGDTLRARLADAPGLTILGPEAAAVPKGAANLVLRAAEFIGVPATLTLEKTLPVAAGIGGGSSDAAAALRLLARLSGRTIPENTVALGADVPVCLLARAARIRGIGEAVAPVALPPLPAVLVNPRKAVETASVFRALARVDGSPMPALPRLASAAEAIAFLLGQRNDLQMPATALHPAIGTVLAALSARPEVRLARMSGSGATCFGLCETMAAATAATGRLRGEHPGWWIRATRLT